MILFLSLTHVNPFYTFTFHTKILTLSFLPLSFPFPRLLSLPSPSPSTPFRRHLILPRLICCDALQSGDKIFRFNFISPRSLMGEGRGGEGRREKLMNEGKKGGRIRVRGRECMVPFIFFMYIQQYTTLHITIIVYSG